MLDLERILRKIIAYRFKKLRGDIPYELISSQRGNMNRILAVNQFRNYIFNYGFARNKES